nr:hypothetical protein CFP56_64761 [Quercus suber]
MRNNDILSGCLEIELRRKLLQSGDVENWSCSSERILDPSPRKQRATRAPCDFARYSLRTSSTRLEVNRISDHFHVQNSHKT